MIVIIGVVINCVISVCTNMQQLMLFEICKVLRISGCGRSSRSSCKAPPNGPACFPHREEGLAAIGNFSGLTTGNAGKLQDMAKAHLPAHPWLVVNVI